MERKQIPGNLVMDERKPPEPGGCNAEILLDLSTLYGISWGQRLVESCGAAVQVYERCQGAAGAGSSSAQRGLGDAGSLPARVQCHNTRVMLPRGSQVQARVQNVGQRRETDLHGNIY